MNIKSRIFILGVLLFAVAATCTAQGRTDGQNSVYLDFGVVPQHTGNNFAYSAKGGWSRVFGTRLSWQVRSRLLKLRSRVYQ